MNEDVAEREASMLESLERGRQLIMGQKDVYPGLAGWTLAHEAAAKSLVKKGLAEVVKTKSGIKYLQPTRATNFRPTDMRLVDIESIKGKAEWMRQHPDWRRMKRHEVCRIVGDFAGEIERLRNELQWTRVQLARARADAGKVAA